MTKNVSLLHAGMAFGAVWLLFLYKAVDNYYRHPGEEHVRELDELFNMLEERRGQCFSVRQYKQFK